eukprot:GFUD01086523.1.p1 GENE.GFUD01086523.1~~GFUD01086523.1.p1  ORF type:complete len:510 (-),score=90.62 GFUD01086523.1:100-1572(-)
MELPTGKKCQQLQEILDTVRKRKDFMIHHSSKRMSKARMDEKELERFLQQAHELYANDIKTSLEQTSLNIPSLFRMTNQITILDTGSVPEMLGRPWQFSRSTVGIFQDLELIIRYPELFAVGDSAINYPKQILKTDHDLMFVLEDLVICNNFPNVSNCCLEIEPKCESGSEHFVQIYTVAHDSTKELLKNTLVNDYLSQIVDAAFFEEKGISTGLCKRLKKYIMKKMFGMQSENPKDHTKILIEQEGPSVNMKVTIKSSDKILLDCDFLLALPLESWPASASEWITRTRKWPSQNTIRSLCSEKCYVVAKPRFPGDDSFWRISFSKQELDLAKELPEKARNVYLRLKVVFKQWIKLVYPELKSYHMKTAFYWWMEEQDPSQWEAAHLTSENLLDSLIQKLMIFIKTGNLPHYFLPAVNLLPISAFQRFRILTKVTLASKTWLRKIRKPTVTINSAQGANFSIEYKRQDLQTKAPQLASNPAEADQGQISS